MKSPSKAPAPKPISGFRLSNTSLNRLQGVDADLVKVVKRAIELTTIDFIVVEGMRTQSRQRELVRTGASKTMNSRHLIGQAVDIAPLIDGQVRWDWPAFYPLALAMRDAAKELGVTLTWGGVWDRRLNALSADMGKEVKDYCARHAGSDFIDGPHYQVEK